MHRHVAMSLFKTIIFLDVMKVVATDDDSPLHFHFLDDSCKNSTPNRDITSEGTLLVNVGSLNCL